MADRDWYAGGGYLTAEPRWTSSPAETYVFTNEELEQLLANMRVRLDDALVCTNTGDA